MRSTLARASVVASRTCEPPSTCAVSPRSVSAAASCSASLVRAESMSMSVTCLPPFASCVGELRFLGRAGERQRRALAVRDRVRDLVEPARADLALVPRGRVADLFEPELALLHLDVGTHSSLGVAVGELEHGCVERVEAGQRDELEPVADGAE